MTLPTRLILAAAIVSLPVLAQAVAPPQHLGGRPELEVAAGAPVRPLRMIRWTEPPARGRAPWSQFLQSAGNGWQVYWDTATGVPGRIFGVGIPAPGSVASAAAAERASRAALARHIDLLAPGASPTDFELVANHLDDHGMRTVGFEQRFQGLRVLGGQVSFRFKNDRLFVIGSEALPDVAVGAAGSLVAPLRARAQAEAWVSGDLGVAVRSSAPAGAAILPLVRGAGDIEYRRVVEVAVDAPAAPARYAVYLDAASGAPVARRQLLRFADATLRYNAPDRWYGSTRSDVPAPFTNVSVNGMNVETDANGQFSWTGTTAEPARSGVVGPLVDIVNAAGSVVVNSFTAQPGGSMTWNRADVEFDDAQLTTFISLHRIKAFAKIIAPTMTFLDQQITGTVNIDMTCNANSDGQNVNFFRSGMGCANTGRISDVVYHEFGHSFHAHAIIAGVGSEGDGSLGEGQADFMAAQYTGDSGVGRGFFLNDDPLRELNPVGYEYSWPRDVGEIHDTGRIFGGAMWDVRTNLISSLGTDAGKALAAQFYYHALMRAVDIPSTYVEIIAYDDDDGNLANGTPHLCDINEAFGRHNLVPPGGDLGILLSPPVRDTYHLSLHAMPSPVCHIAQVQSATVEWQVRGASASSGPIPMTQMGDDYVFDLPEQPSGTVVQYKVQVALSNSSVFAWPNNLGDPYYEFFVGQVVPLYCTDFEGTSEPEGWTHGKTRGPVAAPDPWQWGSLSGMGGGGDPTMAYSGTKVYGMDLGNGSDDGTYTSNTTSFLQSPSVDTKGYTKVRLQFRRWLTVEQGFYDHAKVYGNGMELWTNPPDGMDGSKHALDHEWVFKDLDLGPTVMDGHVQVKFELASDPGLEFGGWTLDDFCVVGVLAPGEVPPTCGNGTLDPPEQCDDGNLNDGDGCDHACMTEPPPMPMGNGNGGNGGGCGCAVGGRSTTATGEGVFAVLGLALVGAAGRRSRRSRRSK